jgi:HSP20 family molecular chaperone IbpA
VGGRLISLPPGADPDKMDANFKDGLLTVTVGKSGESRTSAGFRLILKKARPWAQVAS